MTKKTIKVIKLNEALISTYKTKKNSNKINTNIINANPDTLKEVIQKKYKTKVSNDKKVRFDIPKKVYKGMRSSKKKKK